jgi:hypothetical protein
MIDGEFIRQCADPRLSVEIVQQFVEEIAAPDHLQVTVKSGMRTYAVPRPTTAAEAMDVTKQYVGQAIVRVGLTQYPAGFGIENVDQLSMNLFDSCENLRMGTAMFSKIYRVVTKWYGNPRPEAFEDAMLAYASGYFEGKNVFEAEDPGDIPVWKPASAEQLAAAQSRITGEDTAETPVDSVGEVTQGATEGSGQISSEPVPSEPPLGDQDPNRASMRINLTGIKAHNIDPSVPAR